VSFASILRLFSQGNGSIIYRKATKDILHFHESFGRMEVVESARNLSASFCVCLDCKTVVFFANASDGHGLSSKGLETRKGLFCSLVFVRF